MMEQYELKVSKIEFVFNGDGIQRMVHYCRGRHSQTMGWRQEIIGAGSAAIDEAGVRLYDLTTNPMF